MNNDKITICKKCGGPLCYESHHENNIKSWMCLNCGFQTISLLKKGSDLQSQQEETLPELYKDLAFIDVDDRVWYPCVLNYPEKGIIFAEGTSKNNWHWTAMLATKVLEEEKHKFKKPNTDDEYFEYKMDNKTKKPFLNFIEAVTYIGII